jgi:hypothetical protein
MRATFNGQHGELTIEHCTILRFMENGSVRKFYQQMLVQFTSDGLDTTQWSVSNWGPGAEAAWAAHGDLKGGLKSDLSTTFMAEQANDRQVATKIKGGYTYYTEFSGGANVTPPPKLLAELGVRALLKEDEERWHAETPAANARWQPLADLQATATDLSSLAMHCIVNGDLSSAIASRQTLIDLMGEIRTLHESTQGQLEMLTLKLAAELKK